MVGGPSSVRVSRRRCGLLVIVLLMMVAMLKSLRVINRGRVVGVNIRLVWFRSVSALIGSRLMWCRCRLIARTRLVGRGSSRNVRRG